MPVPNLALQGGACPHKEGRGEHLPSQKGRILAPGGPLLCRLDKTLGGGLLVRWSWMLLAEMS